MEWARQCLALGERRGHPPAIALGYECLAGDLAWLGRWDYADLDRARTLYAETGTQGTMSESAPCSGSSLDESDPGRNVDPWIVV